MSAGARPDAIVVGAGIVGSACALELQRAGLRVLLLERAFVGGEASAAGMGHVVVMDDSPAQLALTAWSRALWSEWAAELPADCEDQACGTLWLAQDDAELQHARSRAALYRAHGVQAEILDAAEVARAEPQLRPDLRGALFVPADRVLYPPAAARFLAQRAVDLGARLREGVDVLALDPRSVLCADGTRIDADTVVLAAGVAAARLLPELPIAPRRGHLVITERYPGFCRHQLVESGYLKSAHGASNASASVAFNCQPRATGQLLIGSSREFVGLDTRVDPALRARMLRRAVEFLPGLRRLQALRAWVGFRPATPDKLPLIGRHAALEGVWLAAGHEGLGITTATGSARLLAELVTGRRPSLDARPFDPARYPARPAGGDPLDTSASAHRATAAAAEDGALDVAFPRGHAATSLGGAAFAIEVDGRALRVTPGTTVAVALWNAGLARLRTSVAGNARGPLCAMGICFECRVTLDGVPHQRACLTLCRPGLRVSTT